MFPFTLAELLANKYVKYAAAAVAIAALVWAFAVHFKHVGAVEGKADAAQQVADAIEKMHVADRAEFKEQLAPLVAAAESAQKDAAAAHQLSLSIISQRQAVTQQVAGMSDAAVDAKVAKQIGDLDLPEVRRQILACNEQLPLCEQEAKAAHDEAAQKTVEASKWEGAYRKTDGYVDTLEREYAQLYNVKAIGERSWKCMKLWRCSKPQIAVPAPTQMKRPEVLTSQGNKG